MELNHYIEQLYKVTAEYFTYTEIALDSLMCDDLLSFFFSVKLNFLTGFFQFTKMIV